MDLIRQLNENVNKLELHVSGSPKHSRRGGTIIKGYVYDRSSDKEVDVEIQYEYEHGDPGDHWTPGSDSQVHIYKVTREGGGEIPVDSLDLHDAEVDLHDTHRHDNEDHRY